MAEHVVSSNERPIRAELTSWFWRRSLIMLAVFSFVALFFLYDGLFGYPNKNAKLEAAIERRAEIWQQLDTETERNRAWLEYAEQTGGIGDSYTEEKMREKMKSERQIQEQFWYAAGIGLLAIGWGIHLLRKRGQCLILEDEALVLPGGEQVSLRRLKKVDRRKWHKGKAGLAYVFYETESGETKRATIDGLKYGGFSEEGEQASKPEQIMAGLLEVEGMELLDLEEHLQGGSEADEQAVESDEVVDKEDK